MPRRPTLVDQATIARALRAAKATGAGMVEVRSDGTIRILLAAPPPAPEPSLVNEWDSGS